MNSNSISPQIIAMYPAFTFLAIVLYLILRNASRRTGIPIWQYFVGSKEVRRTLTALEQVMGVLAQLGALAIFFAVMKLAEVFIHGA
jgi:hypothetical protein